MVEGQFEEALDLLRRAKLDLVGDLNAIWINLAIAEAALACKNFERAAEALGPAEALPPGSAGPLVRAQAARFRASVAAAEGDAQRAEDSFKMAAAAFGEYETPFLQACTQLEHAEWLASQGRNEDVSPLVTEARETFERLRATPWLERADALASRVREPAAVR
jgi:ATP/maltotriose-dependent transcriptional regulator MalT